MLDNLTPIERMKKMAQNESRMARASWGHLHAQFQSVKHKNNVGRAKINVTDDTRAEIIRMANSDITKREIILALGVTDHTVRRVMEEYREEFGIISPHANNRTLVAKGWK